MLSSNSDVHPGPSPVQVEASDSPLLDMSDQAVKRMIPKAKYASFETEQEAALDVINGRSDAFVYDHPFNAIMATTIPIKNREVRSFEEIGLMFTRIRSFA